MARVCESDPVSLRFQVASKQFTRYGFVIHDEKERVIPANENGFLGQGRHGKCASCYGKAESEAASFPWLAMDPDSASLLFNQSARDSESQAGAFSDSASSLPNLPELLKDDFLIFRFDAYAAVVHGYLYECPLHARV